MSNRAKSQATPETSLKSRLISATAELVSESKPPRLPTMREISGAAGVSLGAAYRHFDSQDDLFLAVVSLLFEDLERHITEARSPAMNLGEVFEAIAIAYVFWGLNNPGGYQLLFETTDDPKLLERGFRPGLHLVQNLSEIISGGKKPSAEDQQNVLRLWASLHGLVSLRNHKLGMQWLNTPESEVRSILRMHIRN